MKNVKEVGTSVINNDDQTTLQYNKNTPPEICTPIIS